MTLDFVKKTYTIGSNGDTVPPFIWFKKGFNLGGSGGSQWQDIILDGNGSLTLANAKANSLNYLKLFGGCEQIASGNVGTAYIANTTTEITGDITNVPRTDLSTPAVSLLKSGNITTDNVPDVDWTKDWELLVENTKITASNDIGNAISVYLNSSVAIQIYPYSGLKLYGVCYIDGSQTSYSDTITLNTNYDFRISYEERSGLRAIWIDYKLSSSDTWTPLLQKNITLTQPSVSYIGLSSRWNDKIPMPINLSNVTFTNDGVVKYSSSASSVPTPDAPMDIVCNNGALKVRHQSGLPLGYQPYEYITASGNQWLNTGVKLESTDVVETEFKNSSRTGYGALYGVFALGSSSAFYANGTYYGYDVANGKVDTGISVDTNWHTLRQDFGNGIITLDGNNTTYTPFEFDNAKDNYLFARYYNNSYGYGFKGSCKRYKVIRNGVLICDLIPVVQLSDNAVGMYDLVNNVFRGNLGADAFTAGNPISDAIEIYTDGTVETVMTKQAFVNDSDIVDRTGLNSSNGSAITNNNRCYVLFPCKAGVTYTAQTDTADLIGGNFIEYNQPEATSTNFVKSLTAINDGLVGGVYKFHAVCDTDGWAGWQCKGNKATALANNWQITSDIATATAEPLLAVGDYKDIQEVKTGAITRNVGIKVLDGTENWVVSNRYAGSCYWTPQGATNIAISYMGICTHFPSISAISQYTRGKYLQELNAINLWYSDNATTAVADLKQFLAEQYNAGTPVMVVYALYTPTTETVTAQPLNIQAGTNIVEITQASIDNLPLEVSYKGTV